MNLDRDDLLAIYEQVSSHVGYFFDQKEFSLIQFSALFQDVLFQISGSFSETLSDIEALQKKERYRQRAATDLVFIAHLNREHQRVFDRLAFFSWFTGSLPVILSVSETEISQPLFLRSYLSDFCQTFGLEGGVTSESPPLIYSVQKIAALRQLAKAHRLRQTQIKQAQKRAKDWFLDD